MRLTTTIPTAAAIAAALLTFSAPTHAENLMLAAHANTVAMPDGWKLTVGHRGERINRVPALNGIGTTREAFTTNQTYGSLHGHGSAMHAVILRTGYQVGCAVDLTSITLGASVTAGFVPSIVITPGIPTPTLGATIGPTVEVAPNFQVTLAPGKVVDVPTGEKPVESGTTFITTRNAHLKIDGCLGPASIRSYSIIAAQSTQADDSTAVYGDTITL